MRALILKISMVMGFLAWSFVALGVPSDVDNPQGALWNLFESGRESEALQMEADLKALLKAAPIQKISPLGGGVSKAWLVYFPNNIVAVLKGQDPHYENAPQKEAAAYLVDRAMGLNMVPVTVLRNIQGMSYSLQLYYPSKRPESVSLVPELETSRAADMALFDYILHNLDRKISEEHNLLTGKDGRLIGIDHSRSFYSTGDYAFDLEDKNLENSSANFKASLERINKPQLFRALMPFVSIQELKDFKGRLNFVRSSLSTVHNEGLDRSVPVARIPEVFNSHPELRGLPMIEVLKLQNILGESIIENPFKTLNKFTDESFSTKDLQFKRVLSGWSSFSESERVEFFKTLIEVRGWLGYRYAIPKAIEEVIKIFPADLHILEKALTPSLRANDFSYFVNRLGKQPNLSAGALQKIKKILWSELGPSFVDSYFMGTETTVYNSKYEALLLERVMHGVLHGEFHDGIAFNVLQNKGMKGLPALLSLSNKKRRAQALEVVSEQLRRGAALIQEKQWDMEYKTKIQGHYSELVQSIEFSQRAYRCENLF